MQSSLIDLLTASVARRPTHVAVEDASDNSVLTYAELGARSDHVRDHLRVHGVVRGDRVGVYMRKCIDAYVVILGIMKAGAAYVPIDRAMPAWRAAFITNDCGVRALVIEEPLVAAWAEEASRLGPLPSTLQVNPNRPDLILAADTRGPSMSSAVNEAVGGDDLAYILYTSGSTGAPKGVTLTHRCGTSHVNWCAEVFDYTQEDRFSSHAPFHFDLSITDLYVPLKLGATVVLIPSDLGKEPIGLARLIAEHRLTIWYSTPAILTLLVQFGRMERHNYSALRDVLFAGEVFALKHLRAAKRMLPNARFYNLYGPTETNVCTWHPIPATVEDDRTTPFPIGRTCSHFQSRVVDEHGCDVVPGAKGELLIRGSGTFIGYWNDAERTAAAFREGPDGLMWYRTGDLVVEEEPGVYSFAGRRDRMVKRRGYRIELGEIEAGLYRHAAVKEVAVVAASDAEGDVRIHAFVAFSQRERSTEIQMRAFCARTLPDYMVPDRFQFIEELPKTSTDKIDYQRLIQNADGL